ncbi:MAG: class I SAM-dependent methyltransferase, partial [Nitrososphaera sp.]|nr:class I SAM-dependent methyltransferase [Nitrososphaera sp.]
EINMLKEKGYLNSVDMRNVNAESIDFPDNSFDFVLCKSTFHHLPRAPLAFYEFLRVCREAAIYIEPAEPKGIRLLDYLRSYAKLILRKQAIADQLFEGSGNFIYRLSEREIRKQCTAMQLNTMGFKYFNDFFHPKLSTKQKSQQSAMLMFKFGVGIQDLLCRLKLMNYARIALIVFKNKIDKRMDEALRQMGYCVEYLPRNPFI